MQNPCAPLGGGFLLSAATGSFTPEQRLPVSQAIGQCATDFLQQRVLPQRERIEKGDHPLMHQLMEEAGALGLLGADVPVCYGGLGLDIPTAALIAEKLNFQQSFALTHEAHTVIATLPLLYFGTHDQKARYLPKLARGEWIGSFALSEANSGSDALAMTTRGVLAPSGDHYRVTGFKTWITNSAFARLFTVFGRVGDKYTAFLVERDFPGVSFGPEENKLGMRGTSTRRVMLDNVPVPLENVLPLGTGHYAALCALNLGRFKLEAGAVGGLKELLRLCCAYTRQRHAFGKPLCANGLVQAKLAAMAARTYALESMVYRLAGDLEALFAPIDPEGDEVTRHYHHAAEELTIECNLVKIIGSEAYSFFADEAIQLHGGYGYTENFLVAQAWRDQRLLRIGEGANEVVRVAVVQQLLRRDTQGRLPVRSAPLPEDPLKRLALLLLRRAEAHLGTAGLIEAQEAAAPIADIVCAAFACESMALRRCPEHAALEAVARAWFRESAYHAARESLACLDSAADGELALLLPSLAAPEGNPLRLQRALAEQVMTAGGWPLG